MMLAVWTMMPSGITPHDYTLMSDHMDYDAQGHQFTQPDSNSTIIV